MQRLASIDIGSQTIRLLIADCDGTTLYPRERRREIVGLGSGLHADSLLRPDRIEQAAACIGRFCAHARAAGAGDVIAMATACVRLARNRQAFIENVQQHSGILPSVIPEEREAQLSLTGVLAVVHPEDESAIIMDIGGGSTELSFLNGGIFQGSTSLPLGAIEPAERFMHTDPPADTELMAIRAWVDGVIGACPMLFEGPPKPVLPRILATAGTATTLAAMDLELHDYQPARINHHVLTVATLDTLLRRMTCLPLKQRARLTGLEPGRARVIIPGTLILQRMLQHFNADCCTVSDAGLLEGILIQHAGLKKIIEKT